MRRINVIRSEKQNGGPSARREYRPLRRWRTSVSVMEKIVAVTD